MPFLDDPEDPYSTCTVMGWIRSWKLGQALEAGYSDQEAIQADYEKALAAEKAEAEAFWAQMAADGVPVASLKPEAGADTAPEPEPEASV